MEEIDELLRDDCLRAEALSQAITRCHNLPIELGPRDVVSVANIFYQFLKGETK